MTEKHGLCRIRAYRSWADAKSRCNNQRHRQYANYGGRGIRMCERWAESFARFYEDMGDKPNGLTLDRIDNDGDYRPGNCRWATYFEQNQNMRHRPISSGGFVGVYFRRGRFEARFTRDGKTHFLGKFGNIYQAIAARYVAEKRYEFQIGAM